MKKVYHNHKKQSLREFIYSQINRKKKHSYVDPKVESIFEDILNMHEKTSYKLIAIERLKYRSQLHLNLDIYDTKKYYNETKKEFIIKYLIIISNAQDKQTNTGFIKYLIKKYKLKSTTMIKRPYDKYNPSNYNKDFINKYPQNGRSFIHDIYNNPFTRTCLLENLSKNNTKRKMELHEIIFASILNNDLATTIIIIKDYNVNVNNTDLISFITGVSLVTGYGFKILKYFVEELNMDLNIDNSAITKIVKCRDGSNILFVKILKYVIDHGINVKLWTHECCINKNKTSESILNLLCVFCDIDLFKLLIKNGAIIEKNNKSNKLLIQLSKICAFNHIKYLIDECNVNPIYNQYELINASIVRLSNMKNIINELKYYFNHDKYNFDMNIIFKYNHYFSKIIINCGANELYDLLLTKQIDFYKASDDTQIELVKRIIPVAKKVLNHIFYKDINNLIITYI